MLLVAPEGRGWDKAIRLFASLSERARLQSRCVEAVDSVELVSEGCEQLTGRLSERSGPATHAIGMPVEGYG